MKLISVLNTILVALLSFVLLACGSNRGFEAVRPDLSNLSEEKQQEKTEQMREDFSDVDSEINEIIQVTLSEDSVEEGAEAEESQAGSGLSIPADFIDYEGSLKAVLGASLTKVDPRLVASLLVEVDGISYKLYSYYKVMDDDGSLSGNVAGKARTGVNVVEQLVEEDASEDSYSVMPFSTVVFACTDELCSRVLVRLIIAERSIQAGFVFENINTEGEYNYQLVRSDLGETLPSFEAAIERLVVHQENEAIVDSGASLQQLEEAQAEINRIVESVQRRELIQDDNQSEEDVRDSGAIWQDILDTQAEINRAVESVQRREAIDTAQEGEGIIEDLFRSDFMAAHEEALDNIDGVVSDMRTGQVSIFESPTDYDLEAVRERFGQENTR